jgi:hypothetical protein
MHRTITYTVKENHHPSSCKNHILVREAHKKRLTGIKIIRNLDNMRGWVIECDQIPRLHLGFEVSEAIARIEKIETPKN